MNKKTVAFWSSLQWWKTCVVSMLASSAFGIHKILLLLFCVRLLTSGTSGTPPERLSICVFETPFSYIFSAVGFLFFLLLLPSRVVP